MDIRSKANSTIFLLGIDKRVTFVATGNDFDKNTIATPYGNYTSELKIHDFQLGKWKNCTPEELEIFKKDEPAKLVSNGGSDYDYEIDFSTQQESADNLASSIDPVVISAEEHESNEIQAEIKTDDKKVREIFPETWIHEKVNMENKNLYSFEKIVPDPITTWVITAFGLNKEHGFSLAEPVELIVSQDFFIKLYIPNFVYTGEVVHIDVIVFNYFESPSKNKDIHGEVELLYTDSFEVMKKNGTNFSRATEQDNKNISFNVGYGKPQKVTFYIRPTKIGKLNIEVKATSKQLEDIVRRSILVKNFGLLSKNKQVSLFESEDKNKTTQTFSTESECASRDLTLSGDFIANTLTLDIQSKK